jgi:oligoribonuclease NrnB/cAMP/cGMP phosphodiesterase (DHH superfamily)
MIINGTSMINKVKLFTHYDLDGVGCAIIAKRMFGESVDIELIDANSSSSTVDNWLSSKYDPKVYTGLIISDLSVSVEVANKIENSGLKSYILFDHHKTAEELQKFDWCIVNDTVDYCGTNLMYNYFIDKVKQSPVLYDTLIKLKDFVQEVHYYDNWLWLDAGDEKANDLNNLLTILGKKRFIDRFVKDPSIMFSTSEVALLTLEKEKIESYIYTRSLNIIKTVITIPSNNNKLSYKCGIAFADKYINDLAHKILNENSDIDVAIVIGFPYVMSFRTRSTDDAPDLTPLTTYLGGGGHPASGGAPMNNNDLVKVINYLFISRNANVEFIKKE